MTHPRFASRLAPLQLLPHVMLPLAARSHHLRLSSGRRRRCCCCGATGRVCAGAVSRRLLLLLLRLGRVAVVVRVKGTRGGHVKWLELPSLRQAAACCHVVLAQDDIISLRFLVSITGIVRCSCVWCL